MMLVIFNIVLLLFSHARHTCSGTWYFLQLFSRKGRKGVAVTIHSPSIETVREVLAIS